MGDHDQCFSFCQAGNRFLDHCLVLWVNTRRGLIKDDYRRILQHRSRNRNPLLLSAREVTASASADCVIPPVQPADKCPAPGLFRCSFHLFICGIRPSHPDIFPDCPVKEIIILRHICDLSIELFHRNTSQISSAKCDPSAAHIPETSNEFRDRGFARSGRAHQSSDRSRHDLHADIMQHFAALFFVCKRNVIQADRCSVQYHFPNRPLQLRRIQNP